jgi:hypothetical protein
MNKKLITVLALAAGVAAYIYSKKKNKAPVEKAYDTMNNAWQSVDSGVENIFS